MLYFPQLMQFPVQKRRMERTAGMEAADGSEVKIADPAARVVEWRLELDGLTDAEWEGIEALFDAVEGRLGTFTFLDPFANLLAWSEDLGAACWAREGEVVLGIADPLGGTGAAAVSGSVRQSIAAPAALRYCLSAWVRSAGASVATLRIGACVRAFAAGAVWNRVEFSAQPGGVEETVEFAVETAGAVEVFGLQVEAQAGASGYKKTGGRSGVHSNARFAEDRLERRGEAVNWNAARVGIVSTS